MKQFLLICGLVFILSLRSWSQNGIVKHFGVEDGLSSNKVYSAFQDSRGFMWFTTTNGVSRFDGKEFKNFTSNQGLPDNDIFGIAEDAVGRLWLSCYNGEPCYIYNNRVFTSSEDTLLKQIPKRGYFRFRRLARKLILTKSENNGSYEVDQKGKLRKISLEGVFFSDFKENLLNIGFLRTHHIYTYCLFDSAYKKVDSLILPESIFAPEKRGSWAEKLYVSGDNSFVIPIKNDACLKYRISHNKIIFEGYTQKVTGFADIYNTSGKLWISAPNQGIIPVTDKFSKDPRRETLFPGCTAQNFLIDREGNYWCCTSGNGLYLIPNNNFSYYTSGNNPDQKDILKLASYHNEIYLIYANTILKYPSGNSPYSNSLNNFIPLQDKIVDMHSDSLNLVVATTQSILFFNKKTRQIKKTRVSNIKCMEKGPDNSVLFGTHSACSQLFFPDSISPIVTRLRTVAVYPRKNKDVLIGTLFGLYVARKNGSGMWTMDTIRSPSILRKTRISCIAETDSILVIGTVQKGLILISGNDYEFVDLGPGLSDINCKDIFIDADKNIWLASFSGIFKIKLNKSIHSYEVENIRKFNGLLSDDVNSIIVVNDTVYVAGSNGLTFFSKKDRAGSAPPTTYINDVRVNGISYPVSGKEIQLPADSNTIDLYFSGIDFKSLGNIRFKYRLSAVQKNWYYSTDNFAHFEALPPGDYKFEVWAMNAANVWSSASASLQIHISPAWWQSAWFYGLLIILGALVIYATVRLYFLKKHRVYMREHSLRRHVAELELRAIKAQMNPHFIFNTLNAIQYFINNHESEKADNYLNRLADLLRKTLDFSDKTTVPVYAEINYLENYLELEKLRFDENFIFTITSLLSPSQENTEIPPMVLQPHVENALRHAFKDRHNTLKKLDITFSMIDDQLICEVSDNGIGRKASSGTQDRQYRSRGIELSHSKLLLYESITGKKIETNIRDNYAEDETTATGTSIRISITQ